MRNQGSVTCWCEFSEMHCIDGGKIGRNWFLTHPGYRRNCSQPTPRPRRHRRRHPLLLRCTAPGRYHTAHSMTGLRTDSIERGMSMMHLDILWYPQCPPVPSSALSTLSTLQYSSTSPHTFWKAIPMHLPSSSTRGPPHPPLFTGASTWTNMDEGSAEKRR